MAVLSRTSLGRTAEGGCPYRSWSTLFIALLTAEGTSKSNHPQREPVHYCHQGELRSGNSQMSMAKDKDQESEPGGCTPSSGTVAMASSSELPPFKVPASGSPLAELPLASNPTQPGSGVPA